MTPLLSPGASSLLSLLPVMKRARGWRLYAADGARYLDLYADGGRSVLGRRNGESGKTAKEAIDRGLVSAFPSFWKKRLEKQILAWLPGYAGMRFFASETEAVLTLAMMDDSLALRLREGHPLAEALRDCAGSLRIERPFSEYRRDSEKVSDCLACDRRYAIAILPLAPAWSFGIVLGKTSEAITTLTERIWGGQDKVPQGDGGQEACIPAIKLSTAARSLSDFTAFAREFDEKRWAAIDPFIGDLFVRSGPWLYPSYPQADHGRVFAACLENGILISPDYDEPSIVPPEFDAGEVAPLRLILSMMKPTC